jgi:predicted DNA-binding protein YlxM (UPF0122 family)
MNNPDTERAIATLTKEFLIEEHINKRIHVCKIAKDNHFAKVTVLKYLKKFGIPSEFLESILTKEYLEEHYINKKLSSYEIAELIKTNASTIRQYLRKHNIPVRSYSEAKIGIKTGPRSEETKLKMKASRPRGKDHHNWKGGITPLRNDIHNLTEYSNWISEVYRRDNYTCQDCGARSGNGKTVILEAHHIKEFKDILKEFLQIYKQFSPIEDKETLVRLAISYQPFWDIINGKTLCYECHGKTYKKEKQK